MDETIDPCVGLCMIGDDGLCEGCGRSEDEIYGMQSRAPTNPAGGADES